ncbi:serine hydrolase [Lysinibacter cavernae]|uniref:Beta-lactamase class A n=1 Tax=Lysinibacter cavernae TaxID=1640652 RepID=A0A7X5QYD9_9MICO|nr:serine hydrolase [Lysinibacter cavernae]NIH52227.1 beta-lactamase class A [Lysinibacter cavernae]
MSSPAPAPGIISDYSDGIPTVAFCLIEPSGTVRAERGADILFYSASTIKLGVLIAALREVERGRLSLDSPIVVSHTFTSAAPGGGTYLMEAEETDPGMAAVGQSMPLADVLRRMIVVSANCATNLVAQTIGLTSVNELFADAGAAHTVMGRPFSDGEGLRAGLTNATTARDLATLMHLLCAGALLNAQLTEIALGLLRAQELPAIGVEVDAVAARDGGSLDWGSKSGAVTGIEHDVAFFGLHGTPPYSLAVCTRAYAEAEGVETIKAVASSTIQLTALLP